MATTYTRGRIYKLPLAVLKPNPDQPRKFIDPIELSELTASIRQWGVLSPILFRPDEEGTPVVVAGERRVAAAGAAGLTTVPGLLTMGNPQEISLVENLLRVNLTPVEEAEALERVMKECSYNQTQLSEMIGKTPASVSQSLSLMRLPEGIRNTVRTNPNIPKTALMEVAKAKTEAGMQLRFQRYMARTSKEGQPPGQAKTHSTRERALLRRMDELCGEIQTLPWGDWNDDDRHDLENALRGLRQSSSDLLDNMGAVYDEREAPSPGAQNFS